MNLLQSMESSSLFSRRSSPSKTGTTECPVIPPNHPSRTLVLCFYSRNGLGRKYHTNNSIITTFFDLLINDDRQTVYDRLPLECWKHNSTFNGKLKTCLDKDCAYGIGRDIEVAYHDLVQDYRPGDKISLFGFSRGAYTARAVAEMVHKDVDDDWHKTFAKFKELEPNTNVSIDFVGVWDTVSSVGDVIPTTLPFTRSNTSIRVFRHALALDEPRARLHPKFCEFDTQDDEGGTDVEEVWFAGSHCDIGGCAVPKDSPHSLGRIALRWMVRECFRADTGIRFDAERLREIGLDPASLCPIVKERPRPLQPRSYHFDSIVPPAPMASEEEHDVRDALSPMHDQFTVFTPLWWTLKFLPIKRHIPLGSPSEGNESQKTMRVNIPRGLVIPKDHSERFYIYRTVRTRMEAKRLRGGTQILT